MRVLPALGALAVTALALTAAAPPPGAASAPLSGAAERSYIVVLDDDAAPGSVARAHGKAHGLELQHVYRNAVKGYSARMSARAAAEVAADPDVAWVQPDGVVTTTEQSLPTGIDRAEADQSSTVAGDGTGSVDVDVAIIDTGIDSDHTDLDVVGGYNCSNGPSHKFDDGNGHGTHVAGTVGALDDNAGVVGVAPGSRLWAVRVLNNRGSGSWSDVVCGIDWVTANADVIEVANMSLGGPGTDYGNCGDGQDAMHAAICNAVDAGVTFVVAAGNDSEDAAGFTPAAYDEVITVSALADFDGQPGGNAASTCRSDEDDTLANFSNYGADVDLIAPGVCIESTWKGGGYNTISGTSMASPHVAGGAALYLANNPGASPDGVKSALQSAGSTDWDDSDDPDGIKEVLLDVGGF